MKKNIEFDNVLALLARVCLLVVALMSTHKAANGEVPLGSNNRTLNNKISNESISVKISGLVNDENNVALPGVSVLVKGTTIGTTTDIDGKFVLDVPETNAVLVFSFIGYISQEVNVGAKTYLSIQLSPDTQTLSEVVVVGYGTQKRSDITGSVASVPKDRLSNLPVTNLMQAIQGTTAGLNVVQSSAVPGSSGTMQIRGVNSINANTSPFIVLDGVPFFGQTNDINTADIESIEILKDASAVAIYGTRGANGVILITTKRGKSGKPRISYNGYAGLESIAYKLTPMSPERYVEKYADYMEANNLTQTQILPNTSEVNNYNSGVTTDWLDEATKTGRIQEHDISISGGGDNVRYYVTTGYLDQKGVVHGYQYKRVSVRSNLDVDVTKFLKVGTSTFYTNNNYDGGRVNLLNATAMSPYSQPKNANGEYIIHPMFPELLFANPLIGLTVERVNRANNLTGGAYAELIPGFLKGLKYRANASYMLQFGRYSDYSGRKANDLSGTGNVSNTENTNWVIENILTYSKDINKHHIDATALYSSQRGSYFGSNVRGTGFINDQLSFNNLGAGTTSGGSTASQTSILSQMFRINYAYDSRYLLSMTARRDGYSAFGAKTDKYAVFPSLAIGWNIHNEVFVPKNGLIDEMKLRLSYGKAGNQAISPNQTATTSSSTSLAFNGSISPGVLAGTLGNEELTWETTTTTNIGLDFGLFESRITGTVELYKSVTDDILLRRNIPNASGYRNVWDNLGKMENKGIEITLSAVPFETADFKWETTLNYSSFRNELLELYGDGKDDRGNGWFIGKSIRSIYDYEMIGIWQEGEDTAGKDATAKPGYLKFKDQLTVDTDGDGIPDAGDGVINAEDRVVQGNTLPKWYGGITNTFYYKNFGLNIFIQASQGSLKNNADLNYNDERGRRNLPAEVGYWTPENKSDQWPGLNYNNPLGYGYPMDNSYVRIKDITLSYTFPTSSINSVGMNSVKIYVAGRNLYTFTDWIGWDPENNQAQRGSGDWANNYPQVRSLVMGVNISL